MRSLQIILTMREFSGHVLLGVLLLLLSSLLLSKYGVGCEVRRVNSLVRRTGVACSCNVGALTQ